MDASEPKIAKRWDKKYGGKIEKGRKKRATKNNHFTLIN
jgi:hypothetical protein